MSKLKQAPPQISSEPPTMRGLARSLVVEFLSTIRQNKLAACLGMVACIAGVYLALGLRYDERDRYRRIILPDVERAENSFLELLAAAEEPPNEVWGLHYFIEAHRQVHVVLRVIRSRWPRTAAGIRAHQQLIRYYELVYEEMAILRTEMSVDEELDYMAEWKKRYSALLPIRENWLAWARPAPAESQANR